MEAEYIEKQAAINAIDIALSRVFLARVGESIVSKIPPADVRPVVLCGGCRWFIDTGYPEIGLDIPKLRTGHCRILGRDVHACWFCGAGEQKEDADVDEKD